MDKARARQETELAFMSVDDELNARDDALPPRNHNNPPAYLAIFQEIDDLFDEAKNFADGEAIESEDMHDAISRLRDMLHEAGKRADELRVEEKKPHDDAAKAVQEKFKPVLAKVTSGKTALGDLLAAWRTRVLREKQAEAARKAAEAAKAAEEAQAAIRASAGNLEARVDAEELLAHAKDLERGAKRADKAAATGTGLRTRWRVELVDEAKALDHYYPLYREDFIGMVLSFAQADATGGTRAIPGFRVYGEKVV